MSMKTNPDNKLKMPVHGYAGWMETKFLVKKGPDGTAYVRPGFKNVLNNQEVFGDEPPYPTGDLSNTRHVGDLYRENYDQIRWER